ncbi:hypothetical protein NPIL_242201, partial [Nephila pilipes]
MIADVIPGYTGPSPWSPEDLPVSPLFRALRPPPPTRVKGYNSRK